MLVDEIHEPPDISLFLAQTTSEASAYEETLVPIHTEFTNAGFTLRSTGHNSVKRVHTVVAQSVSLHTPCKTSDSLHTCGMVT